LLLAEQAEHDPAIPSLGASALLHPYAHSEVVLSPCSSFSSSNFSKLEKNDTANNLLATTLYGYAMLQCAANDM
jgi:hypothetical protein